MAGGIGKTGVLAWCVVRGVCACSSCFCTLCTFYLTSFSLGGKHYGCVFFFSLAVENQSDYVYGYVVCKGQIFLSFFLSLEGF